jgi:hypothetical protein
MLNIFPGEQCVDYRKFSTAFRVRNISITPLHLIIVNQQIFIMKNVIWTMLVSTYLSTVFGGRLN